MVVPGMIARALYPDTIGCATEETCMAFCNSKVATLLIVVVIVFAKILTLLHVIYNVY